MNINAQDIIDEVGRVAFYDTFSGSAVTNSEKLRALEMLGRRFGAFEPWSDDDTLKKLDEVLAAIIPLANNCDSE